MGKATRWLKGLFSGGGGGGGGKKSSKLVSAKTLNKPKNEVNGDGGLGERSGPLFGSFGSGARGVEEESSRAIAMAAATAAVAEAAVAAAQAAAVVVRLTSTGKVCRQVFSGGRSVEDSAAVRIQAFFRGYLARRALKALKGLVKLQALVRGHIVRKQTLRYMQALVRVQARARAYRVLADDYIYQTAGDSFVHHCHNNSRYEMPAVPMKQASGGSYACSQPSNANWLDSWMEQRYSEACHATHLRGRTYTIDDEKNVKVLEIDTAKPIYNAKRRNRLHSMSSDQNIRSFVTTMADSPSKDSSIAHGNSIPSPCSVEKHPHSLSPLSYQYEPVESSESSQHLFSASARPASSMCDPYTPSKSDCSRSFLNGYTAYPNYMAYTESSKAKARSQSAPKQRPPEFFEKSFKLKRVQQTLSSDASASSHGSSSVKFSGKAYHISGRLDRMGMPARI